MQSAREKSISKADDKIKKELKREIGRKEEKESGAAGKSHSFTPCHEKSNRP